MTSPPVASSELRFLPVAISSLDFCQLEMDLYLKVNASEPALYRAGGLEFTPKDAQRLTEQGVEFVYIRVAQHAAYRRMLAQKIGDTVRNTEIGHQQRWSAVRSSCHQMIKDVLLLPGKSEAIEAIGDIGRAFSEWSSDESFGFSYMLDMSAHDFYTTSHMVNVGVGCGLLAKVLKPGDADLFASMVQGGMLHDVGKRQIPEAILNKEGKLNSEEWVQIQKHPALGHEELHKHPSVSPLVPIMARDHHERMDGKGYPNGAAGDTLSFSAKVCAVVDVYDAITAARPYRGPMAPKDALAMMRDGRGPQFDVEIFDAWAGLVERLIKEDPNRAVQESAPGAVRPLSETVVRPPSVAVKAVESVARIDGAVDDRRRHERTACRLPVTAVFVHQGKSLPVLLGEPFALELIDLSRGGVGLRTRWPLSQGDRLSLSFPNKDGTFTSRHVQVVRVRRMSDGAWLAGCCFIESIALAA